MAASVTAAPLSKDEKFEAFYRKYDYLVKHVLGQSGIVDIEDRAQEVWTAFYAGDYMNVYDPATGSASNFIWHFTRTRALGYLGKQHREPAVNALSLVAESEEFTFGEVDESRSEELSFIEDPTFRMMISSVRETLREMPKRGKRDLYRLFNLLVLGYDQKEIAGVMGLSEGTISNCVSDLRRVPAVRQLLDLS